MLGSSGGNWCSCCNSPVKSLSSSLNLRKVSASCEVKYLACAKATTSSAFLALINPSVLFASSGHLECWRVSDAWCFALCAGVLILLLETTLALFELRGYESWPG